MPLCVAYIENNLSVASTKTFSRYNATAEISGQQLVNEASVEPQPHAETKSGLGVLPSSKEDGLVGNVRNLPARNVPLDTTPIRVYNQAFVDDENFMSSVSMVTKNETSQVVRKWIMMVVDSENDDLILYTIYVNFLFAN
ncbi:hypothetical protein Ancab_023099 [Ancistrocladus abbreviatus]